MECSDDAIISINLHGITQSWNAAAERIYGYTAGEAIGESVNMLIPPDRANEESEILGSIQRGLHVGRYETVRRRRDGTSIELFRSLYLGIRLAAI